MNKKLACLLAVLSLVWSAGASAQSTWSMTGGCSQDSVNSGTFGNSYICTQDTGTAANATVSAWSSERGVSGDSRYLTGSGWASSMVADWGGSGWGVVNRTEAKTGTAAPEHSTDSTTTGYDFIMVKFDQASILNQFGIGWGAADSDVTIMRWTGADAPSTTAGTTTYAGSKDNLTSTIGAGGWQLVTNVSNACKDSTGADVASGSCNYAKSTWATGATNASSYWLIAAYNTTMDTSSQGWTTGNDGFKLNFLKATAYTCPTGTPSAGGTCSGSSTGGSVPEPSMLAMLSLALVGAGAARRRGRSQ